MKRLLSQPQAVFFDLDGTLVDTAPDMASALNQLLGEQGHEPLPYETIRRQVSNGGAGLIRLGFGEVLDTPEGNSLRARFLEIYRDRLCHESRLFPGMEAVIRNLEERGIRWGVVTNKPGWLTEPLLKALTIDHRACCIVSGDSVAERKPHPMPLQHASRLSGVDPEACVYVGDARRDIEAGRGAGMRTVAALFGYIPDNERPAEWQADHQVNQPEEIIAWLFPAGESEAAS